MKTFTEIVGSIPSDLIQLTFDIKSSFLYAFYRPVAVFPWNDSGNSSEFLGSDRPTTKAILFDCIIQHMKESIAGAGRKILFDPVLLTAIPR